MDDTLEVKVEDDVVASEPKRRGRPRKMTTSSTQNQTAVKQMIRWIAKTREDALIKDIDLIDEIDAELARYQFMGFELFNTHYLGEIPEAYGIAYVLVKYE